MSPFKLAIGALLLSAAPAIAQDAQSTHPGRTADASNDYEAIQSAKTPIAKAIEIAEREGNGKATEVEFEAESGGGAYEVKVLSQDGGKLTEYTIDANSGQVKGSEDQPIEKYFTRLSPENFGQAATSLAQAIGRAEAEAKTGKAISAEVERDGDKVSYEVTVSTAEGDQEFDIDAEGKVVRD